MKVSAMLHVVALSIFVAFSDVALCGEPTTTRFAARVTLSNGQVAPLLMTRSSRQTGATSTMIFIGDAGIPVVCTEEEDNFWNQSTLTIADANRTLVMRYHDGFHADGMPVPVEIRLNGDKKIYRWFLKESGEVTSQQRATQKAVADLPEDFRKDLVTFAILCDAAMSQLMLPTLGVIVPELFPDALPRVAVQTITRLTPEDVTKIFQDSARGLFLKSENKPTKRSSE